MNRKILLTAMFAASVTLTAAILMTTAVGGPMFVPAFAQGDNMTGGGNATDGNMTGSGMTGSGMATPPVMTP